MFIKHSLIFPYFAVHCQFPQSTVHSLLWHFVRRAKHREPRNLISVLCSLPVLSKTSNYNSLFFISVKSRQQSKIIMADRKMLHKSWMKHMKKGHPQQVCNFNTSMYTALNAAPTQMPNGSLNNDNWLDVFKAFKNINQYSFLVFLRLYCPIQIIN